LTREEEKIGAGAEGTFQKSYSVKVFRKNRVAQNGRIKTTSTEDKEKNLTLEGRGATF